MASIKNKLGISLINKNGGDGFKDDKRTDERTVEINGTSGLCGFVNWIGHLCSDLVGSNTTRIEGRNLRGTGLSVPF